MTKESFNQQRVQQNIQVLAELKTQKPNPNILKGLALRNLRPDAKS